MSRKPIRILVLCSVVAALGVMGFATVALADDAEDFMLGVKAPSVIKAPARAAGQNLVPPVNDECAGALVIPDGPYPLCSPITTGVLEAGPDTSSPSATDPASCLAAGQWIANTVWYEWTPSQTAFYSVFACHGTACAPGLTRTTDDDGVIALYTSAGGCAGPFTLEQCNDDGCSSGGPSRFGPVQLNGGTTYYFMVGNWTNGTGGAGAIDQYELRIELATPPANDVCANAEPLQLNSPVQGGMNALTNNDYQVPAACFGAGADNVATHTITAAAGRDVTYSFTAPADGNYSFYMKHYSGPPSTSTNANGVLYLSADCPGSGVIPNCILAANRTAPVISATSPNTAKIGGSEELQCVALTAGQTVYAIVDETLPFAGATDWWIEVTPCVLEMEFNGTPAAADNVDVDGDGTPDGPNSAFMGCPVEGQIFTFPGFPDIDFYAMGQHPAGSRLFATADCGGANASFASVDLDMRLTTTTDTLEYDDGDLATSFGNLCPTIGGAILPGGTNLYLRLNAKTSTASAEPYHLSATVRPPLAEADAEDTEPNDTFIQWKDYVYGSHTAAQDFDYFGFCARKGDYIQVNDDTDPLRDATPAREFFLLFDQVGNALPVSGFGVSAVATSNTLPSPGTLTGTTPAFGSDGIVWRASYTGIYFAGVWEASAAGLPVTLGDYLYQSSLNCGPIAADLAITKDGPAMAMAGSTFSYTVTVTNNGPSLGTLAAWTDLLPAGTELVDFTAAPGWDCVPGPGTLDCFELSGCFDGSAVFTVTVSVPYCTGSTTLVNEAQAGSATADPDPANNVAFFTTQVMDDGTCDDGNACTENDYCDAGTCVGMPVNCDDGNDCTDDLCDPITGCYHVPNTGNACDDGNVCTTGDTCLDGACMPGYPNTDPCNDGNACTTMDTCANGMCVGGPPPNCNDGNTCSNDYCDPMVGCVNECNHTCDGQVKSHGWWKRLCRGPHASGEFISMADVACVNDSCTFGNVQSVADICSKFLYLQHWNQCKKAEEQFMGLLLNVCRCRLSETQPIDSDCGGAMTVGEAVDYADGLLCNPMRSDQDCKDAKCFADEINSGYATWNNSLRMQRTGPSTVTLTWAAPYANPDGSNRNVSTYRIWVRADNEQPFTLLGQVNGNTLTYTHTNATGDTLNYEVTANW